MVAVVTTEEYGSGRQLFSIAMKGLSHPNCILGKCLHSILQIRSQMFIPEDIPWTSLMGPTGWRWVARGLLSQGLQKEEAFATGTSATTLTHGSAPGSHMMCKKYHHFLGY